MLLEYHNAGGFIQKTLDRFVLDDDFKMFPTSIGIISCIHPVKTP